MVPRLNLNSIRSFIISIFKLLCVERQISVCLIIYSVFLQFEWHPPAVGEGFDTQLGAAVADVACHWFHPKVVLDHH